MNLDSGVIIKRKMIKQTEVRNICNHFEHFSLNDHNSFLEDCSTILIDKRDGSDPTRREEYWRRVLKIVTPYGLNMIE